MENFCPTVEFYQPVDSDMLKQKGQKTSPEVQKASLSNGNRKIVSLQRALSRSPSEKYLYNKEDGWNIAKSFYHI